MASCGASFNRATTSVLGLVLLSSLLGCDPMTPATFDPGDDPDSPLSGAAIADDGDTFQLSNFGEASTKLFIVSGGESGTRNFEFDLADGQAFAREVGVGDAPADNSLSVNRTAGTATTSLDIPGVGRTDLTVTLEDPLGQVSRRANQASTACTTVRDACNDFCAGYRDGAEASQAALTDLVLAEADAQGIDDDAFIEETIAEIFEAVSDFCAAWAEVQAGVEGQTDPVDVCATEG